MKSEEPDSVRNRLDHASQLVRRHPVRNIRGEAQDKLVYESGFNCRYEECGNRQVEAFQVASMNSDVS